LIEKNSEEKGVGEGGVKEGTSAKKKLELEIKGSLKIAISDEKVPHKSEESQIKIAERK